MTRPTLALAIVIVLAGCGPSYARSGPIYPGRAEGPPSMECLPDADVTEDAYTLHMRRGLELAASSFDVPPPEVPAEHTATVLTTWAEGPLRTWLEHKTQAVDAARQELDAAAEENHRQRIMGGAVVGLMFEDIALVLRSVPSPDDLADEPEILAAFEHVIDGQAHPYLETARAAYHACSLNALSAEGMQHWSRFCADRFDALPDRPDAPDGTEVEILHD